MKIQTYEDMIVDVVDKSPIPAETVQFALDLTQKRTEDISGQRMSSQLGKFLLEAEHGNPLEHPHITFRIVGVSRAFLAQITRQRTFNQTSASQHYQDYRDYPFTLRPEWDVDINLKHLYNSALKKSLDHYKQLIELGEPPEEARMVLPQASCVNEIVTCDARNLALFLKQRLCYRNVSEMMIFANKVRRIAINWFPELFKHVGPQCFMDGKCKQGKMSCGNIWKE